MKDFFDNWLRVARDLDIVRECCDGQCSFKDGQDCGEPQEQGTLQPVSSMAAGSMTLGAGQALHGTRWKVKQFPELFDDLYFEPPPWMLDLLGHPTENTDTRQTCLTSEEETPPIPRLPRIILKPLDATRWQWACGAPLHAKETRWLDEGRNRLGGYSRMVLQKYNMWPRLSAFQSPGLALSFSFASASYGALHALAWSAASPSKVEITVWRVAVCVLTGGLPLFLLW